MTVWNSDRRNDYLIAFKNASAFLPRRARRQGAYSCARVSAIRQKLPRKAGPPALTRQLFSSFLFLLFFCIADLSVILITLNGQFRDTVNELI